MVRPPLKFSEPHQLVASWWHLENFRFSIHSWRGRGRTFHSTSTISVSFSKPYRTRSSQHFTKHVENYSYQFELMIRIANCACAFCHLSNKEWERESESDGSLKRWQKSERRVKRWKGGEGEKKGRVICVMCLRYFIYDFKHKLARHN